MDNSSSNLLGEWFFNIYTGIGWLLIVVIGTILGYKDKIVVFRDYNDLGLAFLVVLMPMPLMYFLGLFSQDHQQLSNWIIIAFESVLFLWIAIRTFKDNTNLIYAVVALITKISLSVLFIINLLEFVSPSGKSASDRHGFRRSAFAILLIVTPLVFTLVKIKKGIFNPNKMLSVRGIRI